MPDSRDKCVTDVVRRNISDLVQARRRHERRQTRSEKLAGLVTNAAGSMWFAYLHVAWFTAWILWNVRSDAPDPFPFGLLTTIVSLEAIFLTLMILVSQNREAKLEEQRSDLDLQIDLLTEHELTKIMCVVDAMAKKMGLDVDTDLEEQIRPRDLLKELESNER